MNPEDVPVMHYTLAEEVQMLGSYGTYAAFGAVLLWVLGIVFLLKKPGTSVRRGYLLACLMPCVLSVMGFASGSMGAFATLGRSGLLDGAKFMSALGEVSLALTFGFIGSGVAFLLAALLWLRGEKTTLTTTR